MDPGEDIGGIANQNVQPVGIVAALQPAGSGSEGVPCPFFCANAESPAQYSACRCQPKVCNGHACIEAA